jgi:hypothetical protein
MKLRDYLPEALLDLQAARTAETIASIERIELTHPDEAARMRRDWSLTWDRRDRFLDAELDSEPDLKLLQMVFELVLM